MNERFMDEAVMRRPGKPPPIHVLPLNPEQDRV
jgi:hypothetical protein